MHQPLWKKLVIGFIKWGLSLAIIGWLIYKSSQDANFHTLLQGEKNWPLLGVAFALCFAAVSVTIWRWHLLVIALGIPFTNKDALRLGFLGFLLNFLSLGIVGGDLFKAFYVAREQPKRRAEAVATVVLDRIIGLYALFVLATVVILLSGMLHHPSEKLQAICRVTLVCTVVGTICMAVLLGPGTQNARFTGWITHLPKIGPHMTQLLWALRLYRHQWGVLTASMLMSFGVHSLFALGVFVAAKALLHDSAPSLVDHLVVVPISMLTGILPLPGNGLGAFEAALDFMYQQIGGAAMDKQGLLVALAYRIITVLIALVGVCVYLSSRREVSQAMHDAEEQQPAAIDADALLEPQVAGPAVKAK